LLLLYNIVPGVDALCLVAACVTKTPVAMTTRV